MRDVLKKFAMVGVAVAAIGVGSQAKAVTQLAMIIDSSSSISGADFAVFRTGVANAMGQVNTDGSVEVSVYQFATSAGVVFAPTVINNVGDRNSLVAAITGIVQGDQGGTTDYEEAFDLVTSTLSFGVDDLQFINMLTDGVPTNSSNTVTAGVNDQIDEDLAVIARDALIAAGADIISFEAVGLSAGALSFLQDDLAFPQPGVVAPPFPNPITANGFVVSVDNFDEIENALLQKFEAGGIITRGGAVPEPVTATLGLMGLGVLAAAARRRAA